MSLIYAFAASKVEFGPIERIFGQPASGPGEWKSYRCGQNQFVLFTTGIGPKRARLCAAAALLPGNAAGEASFIARKPDAAIVVGTCGSLSLSLAETTMVVYTDCLSTDHSQMPQACSQPLTDRQVALLISKGFGCERVVGIASARVATTREGKLGLAKSGASVVDMESYEIVAAARRANIPITVLRVVSDSLNRPMPDFNRAMKPDGDFNLSEVIRVALGSPILTAKLIAANRRAIGRLGAGLEVILGSDCFSE